MCLIKSSKKGTEGEFFPFSRQETPARPTERARPPLFDFAEYAEREVFGYNERRLSLSREPPLLGTVCSKAQFKKFLS